MTAWPLLLVILLAPRQDETVKTLISLLDSETAEQREEAAAKLLAIGRPARAALEAALKDARVEVAVRARAALHELYTRWAAETYRSIEAAALAAKTLQLRFATEIRDKDSVGMETSRTLAGTVLLKDGNRVRIEVTQKTEGSARTLSMISDGKTLWPSMGDESIDAQKGLRNDLTKELVQIGASDWFVRILFLRKDGVVFINPPTTTFPPDPPSEPDAGGVRSIRYELSCGAAGESVQITLFFDAKTLRPVKRAYTFENRHLRSVRTETYSDYVVDGELPDERFVQSAGK